jgi:hypothetical protein
MTNEGSELVMVGLSEVTEIAGSVSAVPELECDRLSVKHPVTGPTMTTVDSRVPVLLPIERLVLVTAVPTLNPNWTGAQLDEV